MELKKFIAEVVMEADTFNYQRMSGKTGQDIAFRFTGVLDGGII